MGADVALGRAYLEACGQMALGSPNFVARLKANSPMNDGDHATYFGATRGAVSTTRC
jgi:N-ethylmaleimide reductase